MAIRFFRGQITKFEHEFRQIREIAEILAAEYPGEPVYLLTNVLVANGEIDAVILTQKGPVIMELKSYRGTITGTENGSWHIRTHDGDQVLQNPFIAAKIHRHDFLARMRQIYRARFPHISEDSLKKMGSWIYFCRGSEYGEDQIDFRKVKWFRVVTADSLIEKLRFLDTGYTLRPEDMEAIVNDLGLTEYDLETNRPIPPRTRSGSRPLITRRAWKIIAVSLAIILVILLIPPVNIVANDALQGVAAMVGGLVKTVSGSYIKTSSTPEDSYDALLSVNQFRTAHGVNALSYDERAFQLALIRARDMMQYSYLDYTNPDTGICADTLKTRFNIGPDIYVTENIYGQWSGYSHGIERSAVEAWIGDAQNQDLLLTPENTAGALACAGGYCSLIGINNNPANAGCRNWHPATTTATPAV